MKPATTSSSSSSQSLRQSSSFFSKFILLDAFNLGLKDADMSTTTTLEDTSHKMVVNFTSNGGGGGGATKRELEKEKSSSVSTDSNSSGGGSGATAAANRANCGRTPNNSGSSTGSATSSKLSKFGKRLRESCRNLRGKSASTAAKYTPEDYSPIGAPKDSNRSRYYVAMDFSGKVGRIVEGKDIRGYSSKDGYTYFRRKVSPKDYEHLLTETQSTVHLAQPWFHKGLGRDMAQRILATHNVDGAFLVRDSSVIGGYVISYMFNERTFHAQVLPENNADLGHVFYSLDDGKTKFFDLLQVVEFYQLNRGSLNTKLTNMIVREEVPSGPVKMGGAGAVAAADSVDFKAIEKSESCNVRSYPSSASCQVMDAHSSSPVKVREEPVSPATAAEVVSEDDDDGGSLGDGGAEDEDEESEHHTPAKMDTNHNSQEDKSAHHHAHKLVGGASGAASDMEIPKSERMVMGVSSATAAAGGATFLEGVAGSGGEEDAAMASEGDSDSLRENQQG